MVAAVRKNLWFFYALTAAFMWGIWGVTAKFVSADISPYTNQLLFTAGMLCTVVFVLKKSPGETFYLKGVLIGIFAGSFALIGNVFVYEAFSNGGQAALVIPVTNLYPLVTILIAVTVFKEKMNYLNWVGVSLSLPAILLLSGEVLIFDNPLLFFKSLGLNVWMMYSFGALLSWGLFSAAQKVTTGYISVRWCYLSFIVSSMIITLFFVVMDMVDFRMSGATFLWGAGAGAVNGLGILASFAAYKSKGKATEVTTVSGAMQPVFTILLAVFFLKESLSDTEVYGIFLAILGASLLSVDFKKKTVLVLESAKVKTKE